VQLGRGGKRTEVGRGLGNGARKEKIFHHGQARNSILCQRGANGGGGVKKGKGKPRGDTTLKETFKRPKEKRYKWENTRKTSRKTRAEWTGGGGGKKKTKNSKCQVG